MGMPSASTLTESSSARAWRVGIALARERGKLERGLIVDDIAALGALVAAGLLAGLLCTGSKRRRLLGLLVAASTLIPPWFAGPSLIRGLLCLGSAMGVMRAVDLYRDRRPQPAARRIWHMFSAADSRLLHVAPSLVDGRTLGVAALWVAASAAGLWIASTAGNLAAPWSWALRWFGGLLCVYAFVEGLWSGAAGAYRLAGFTTPVLHDNPIASRSVRELWGERWSRPVNIWIHANVFKPCVRRGFPRTGLVAGFFASAALHAYAILVGGGALMALTMLAYFLVQGLLVLIEGILGVRRWKPVAAHAWVLGVMLPTSPLFVEPFLRCVGISPLGS